MLVRLIRPLGPCATSQSEAGFTRGEYKGLTPLVWDGGYAENLQAGIANRRFASEVALRLRMTAAW